MVAFAVCLLGAGALLSLLFRAPGLVLVLVSFCVAVAAALVLSPALNTDVSLPIALLVAAVSLQAGYGLAVVLRAVILGQARQAGRGKRALQAPNPAPPNWSQSHDGGPMNRS